MKKRKNKGWQEGKEIMKAGRKKTRKEGRRRDREKEICMEGVKRKNYEGREKGKKY